MRYPIKHTLIAFTATGVDAQRPDVHMSELIVLAQGDMTEGEAKHRVIRDLVAAGWTKIVMVREPDITVIQDPARLYWRASEIQYTLPEEG